MARVIFSQIRLIHVNSPLSAGGLFRARRQLPPSNNEWGPLVDLPDYTVIGKPSPRFTSEGQKRRTIKNYEYGMEIVRLMNEINTTKNAYEELQNKKRHHLKDHRKNYLKMKGNSIKNNF